MPWISTVARPSNRLMKGNIANRSGKKLACRNAACGLEAQASGSPQLLQLDSRSFSHLLESVSRDEILLVLV